MTQPLSRLIVAIIIGATLVVAGESHAQLGDLSYLSEADQKNVRNHFHYGRKAFDKGNYKKAIDHFKDIYAISELPIFLYHIARCYQRLDNPDRAIRYYKKYQEADPQTAASSDTEYQIDQLNQEVEARDSETNFVASSNKERDDNKALKGIGVGALTGLMAVATTPNNNSKVYMPLDFISQFTFSQWFMLTAGLNFGRYIKSSNVDWPETENAVEGQIGLTMGFAFAAPFNDRFSLALKLQFAPTWLRHYGWGERSKFLAFQAGVAGLIHITNHWTVIVELGSNIGRIIVADPNPNTAWSKEKDDYADLGAKVGFAYTFKFTD